MVTVLILLIALGVLGWGLYRARPFGKLGILAWLQSVVLMAPWLVFFGLFAAGVYLNLAGVLLLLVVSIGLYILLGSRLRAAGQDLASLKKFSAVTDAPPPGEAEPSTTGANPDDVEANATPAGKEVEPVAAVREDGMAIPLDDLKAIQGIFGADTFFSIETIPYQNGAIFKGNLRGEVESSYSRLSESLKERVGDRYRLFFVEGPDGKPVVVILPSADDPKPTTLVQWNIALILLLATIATSLETAGLLLGFDLSMQIGRVRETLPIAGGILTVLAANEIGRRLSAQRHQVRLSPPYFIPTWQIGSFGALTRFESNLANRSVLFDVSFAGPATAGTISLGMLIIGLLLSHQGSQFQIPAEFFQGSILVGTLARVVLGSALQQPLVDIHPLTVIGWLGLVITAINLMPAGQLDGGRIVLSIYGRKVARRTTIATLIVLGLASLVNPLALYWAVVILFLQRDLERPSLNELSEPDDARAALGLLVLFLMAATLLPITPSLAGRLGIGG
ncbi:MAG: site-2 protease family protein [Leptolyngbyaceae cyanobacterium SM1_4_3]|nr:site-2 protease family protein [Leptolyngbyaceae cyanobacterium SM1_4_3]